MGTLAKNNSSWGGSDYDGGTKQFVSVSQVLHAHTPKTYLGREAHIHYIPDNRSNSPDHSRICSKLVRYQLNVGLEHHLNLQMPTLSSDDHGQFLIVMLRLGISGA